MEKMVISLVLEETEENLKEIQSEIIKVFGKAIVSYSMNRIEQPKKEIDVSMISLVNSR